MRSLSLVIATSGVVAAMAMPGPFNWQRLVVGIATGWFLGTTLAEQEQR